MARFEVDPDWRAAWRAAGFRRQWRIKRTVGRGLALAEPDDAALAVGIIQLRARRWYLTWITVAAFLAMTWAGERYIGDWWSTAIFIVWSVLVWVYLPFSTGSYKVREALERNEAVTEGFNAFALNDATFEQIGAWRQSRLVDSQESI